MAVGCASAALDLTRELLEDAGVEVDYDRPAYTQSAAAAKFLQLESDLEGARLLMLQAAWMADNRKPNSLEASMAKAKAGRVGSDVTLSCVELCGAVGYSEAELLEKWARDSKILDIFEGTQQIQQLIVARRVLGLSSTELQVAAQPGDGRPVAAPTSVGAPAQVGDAQEHGVDAELGQRRPTGRAGRRRCPRGCARRTPPRRSGRAAARPAPRRPRGRCRSSAGRGR